MQHGRRYKRRRLRVVDETSSSVGLDVTWWDWWQGSGLCRFDTLGCLFHSVERSTCEIDRVVGYLVGRFPVFRLMFVDFRARATVANLMNNAPTRSCFQV